MLFVLVLAEVLVVATVAVETPVVPMVEHPCLLQNLDSGSRLARLLAHPCCVKESSATSVGSARLKVRRNGTHSKSGPRGRSGVEGVEDSLA